MPNFDLALALFEFTSTAFVTLITLFVSVRLVCRYLRGPDDTRVELHENPALALLSATIVGSVAWMVSASIMPAVDAMQLMLAAQPDLTFSILLRSLGYLFAFSGVALLASLGFMFLGLQVYFWSTVRIDEMKEIRSNRLSVAILSAGILFALAVSMRPAVGRLASSMVDRQSILQVQPSPPQLPDALPGNETPQ